MFVRQNYWLCALSTVFIATSPARSQSVNTDPSTGRELSHYRRTGTADRGFVRNGTFGGSTGNLHHGWRDPSNDRNPPRSHDPADVEELRSS